MSKDCSSCEYYDTPYYKEPCKNCFDCALWESIVNETKPTKGLAPRKIYNSCRMVDIVNAMERYILSDKKIPKEWIDELIELNNMIPVPTKKNVEVQITADSMLDRRCINCDHYRGVNLISTPYCMGCYQYSKWKSKFT